MSYILLFHAQRRPLGKNKRPLPSENTPALHIPLIMPRLTQPNTNASTATIGFEAKLWLTAEQAVPAPHLADAEYNGGRPQGLLGLIFLKYISDTFEEHRAKLLAGQGDYAGANAEDPDEYKAENVFWVPAEARWSHLQGSAKLPTIGKTVDDVLVFRRVHVVPQFIGGEPELGLEADGGGRLGGGVGFGASHFVRGD